MEKNENIELIKELQKAVEEKDRKRGKKHEIWKDSFDWKFCETEKFVNQKLSYIHNNPCSGKWKLAESPIHYNHSSAKFYISGKHAAFEVKNVEELFKENLNLSAESLPTGRQARLTHKANRETRRGKNWNTQKNERTR